MEVEKIREQLRTDADLRERVAWRAFEIFASRGYQGGRDMDDWLRAEDEVLQQIIDETEQPTVILKASQLEGGVAKTSFKEESSQTASEPNITAPVVEMMPAEVENSSQPTTPKVASKNASKSGSKGAAKTAPKEPKKAAAATKKVSGTKKAK